LPGRTEAEAVRAFVATLRSTLSCVTNQVIQVGHDGYKAGGLRALVLNGGAPVPLRGAERIHLSVSIHYEVRRHDDPARGPWKIRTRSYLYHLVNDAMDEIILFHWHPDARGAATEPHLHFGRSQLSPTAVISHRAHVPTGRMALESVIQLAVNELGVVPLRGDWEKTLTSNLEDFARFRTWSGSRPSEY
jgi:hypothetical protein